jgi:uncharacterized protein YcbX
MNVSQLYIYPIKSLGGVSVSAVNITDRGFQHDRRWMLIDENNRFLSQREVAEMAMLSVEILQDGLKVYHKKDQDDYIDIPFTISTGVTVIVDIWGSFCKAHLVKGEADKWFSKILNTHCRLVYMPDSTRLPIDENYAIKGNDITSFSDGYPILMISEASLQDLNNKTEEPIPMNRFRPNLVFTGAAAFIEDSMKEFTINGCTFFGVKPSSRCVVTTINQDTTEKGKEPLKTLSVYRRKDAKVYFGENVIAAGPGKINVGDTVTILQTKESLFNNQE